MTRKLLLPMLALVVTAPATHADCDSPAQQEPDAAFTTKVQAFHQQLGIPDDYAEQSDLAPQAPPETLVVAGVDPGQGVFFMTREAADAWLAMQAAARMDGIELYPVSTYRSVRHQMDILHGRIDNGESLDEALKTSAAPGYSEHHTGDAIDINTTDNNALTRDFADTEAFEWLEANAADYCFELSFPEENDHDMSFEPWHWLYTRADDSQS